MSEASEVSKEDAAEEPTGVDLEVDATTADDSIEGGEPEDRTVADNSPVVVEDAEVVEETTGPWKSEPTAEDVQDESSDQSDDATEATLANDAPAKSGTEAEDATTGSEAPSAVALTPPPPPAAKRSGLGSAALLLAGGAIAALIGFFAARYLDDRAAQQAEGPTPTENAALLSEQSARLDEFGASLDAVISRDVAGEIDAAVAPVRSEIDGALADTTTRLDEIAGNLDVLTERVETLALRPVATGIDADAFDEAITEFRGDLDAAIDDARLAVAEAQSEITEARATAEEISDEAFRAEQASVARAALSQVVAALDSGAPYADALAEASEALEAPVPDIIAANADTGIPALAALQESFPDAARAALDASIRSEAGGGALDRFKAFVRVQSGARSLIPREGDDPDAVLSRAEASVHEGNLDAALSEIALLPEDGQAALSDWRSAAETRLAATAAVADLAQQIEQE